MSKKIKIPKAVKGYGYSGVWGYGDHTIGWNTAAFIQGKIDKKYPSGPPYNDSAKGRRFFLCEITIKPLVDKRGRPITKIMK